MLSSRIVRGVDGTRIVTTSKDRTVSIWDAATYDHLAELTGHNDGVLFAAFSPVGDRLVTASEDHTARIWHRHRPEYWWGVAWLPEFWLTVVLGVGLVFSRWRDSRIMRA